MLSDLSSALIAGSWIQRFFLFDVSYIIRSIFIFISRSIIFTFVFVRILILCLIKFFVLNFVRLFDHVLRRFFVFYHIILNLWNLFCSISSYILIILIAWCLRLDLLLHNRSIIILNLGWALIQNFCSILLSYLQRWLFLFICFCL